MLRAIMINTKHLKQGALRWAWVAASGLVLGLAAPSVHAAVLDANFDDFDDFNGVVVFDYTLDDGGIQFTDAIQFGKSVEFGIGEYTYSLYTPPGSPQVSLPNSLSIDQPGGFGAFSEFAFAAADGSLATTVSLTAIYGGAGAGDTITLEGFYGNTMASDTITLGSTIHETYGLSLPTGLYSNFLVIAGGKANAGDPLADFDDVTIDTLPVPEPCTWALLASVGGLLTAHRLARHSTAAQKGHLA